MCNYLKKSKHSRCFNAPENSLGLLALKCFSDLLICKSNFNYSANIAKCLIVFFNSDHKKVRSLIENSIIQIFKTDNHGELSLTVS